MAEATKNLTNCGSGDFSSPLKDDSLFKRFKSEFKDFSDLSKSVESLYGDQSCSLAALVVEHCNGDGGGIPFSKATVTTALKKELYPFGSIFYPGFEMLKNYLEYDVLPEDVRFKNLLENLLTFLLDQDSMDFLLNAERQKTLDNEVRVAAAFAEHVLKKLAARSDYKLDINYSGKSGVARCACGCRTEINIADHFGNTSIGHGDVWHGNLDIILGRSGIAVCPLTAEDDGDSPGGPFVECKYQVTNIENVWAKNQMIAQTIVFSFLQAKRHACDFKHFLVPCIGLSKEELIFYFYDSVEDVLLQSGSMPLTLKILKDINYRSVVALWLVLNYKYFGSGLSSHMKTNVPKSDFHKHVNHTLNIYKKALSLGGVVSGNDSNARFEPYRFNPKYFQQTALVCEYANIKKRKHSSDDDS